MLRYEDIVNAPLGKLKAAADDWSEMTGKLEKLAQDAADGMKARADKAAWEGVNAGVTKAFVAKTAKEFKDAAAEAKGVRMILEEGYTAFRKARDELIRIRDHEAPAADCHVDAKGRVTVRHPASDMPRHDRTHDPDYPALLERQRSNVAGLQARIDLIVDTCNDTDVSVKNSLEANVPEGKDFSAPKYTKTDQEEAARAAGLAAKGRDLTDTELAALNELLRDNSQSADFAKGFYENLGPEKSLAFFGQLSTDTYDYGEVDKERLKGVQELQRNLGLNLATASHDKAFTAEWGPELRKLGTERIPLGKHDYSGPFGYQLLGGIMRYGNYDAKFLNPIAEHVAQLHQKDPNLFAETKAVNGVVKNPFNPSGVGGAGYDPTTAMLEALGNSPDAAKRFFTDPPTAYNEDGSVDRGATADLGTSGGVPVDNYLDFFSNEKWESFGDVNSTAGKEWEESRNFVPDALGRALEAATLGYPAGRPEGGEVRDAENAAIMRQVMEKYGPDAGLLKKHEALADSLGNMGAGYINDINWALHENHPESPFAAGANPEGRVDFGDAPGGNGESLVRDFLSSLGQHPDAYATLSAAEQVYTRSVLEAHVGPDGIRNGSEGSVRWALTTGAEVQGMLDQSRADQVEATNTKAQEDYEKSLAKRAGWVQFGATVGVAAGVAFLPVTAAVGTAAVLVPLATDTASGALGQAIGQTIGDISGQTADAHKGTLESRTDAEREKVFTAGLDMVERPLKEFLAQNGIPTNSVLAHELRRDVGDGYTAGTDRENQQGNRPQAG
ncbi:hypothetical protein [Streptomyces genisteinicus]|uniref:AG2 protein n=1 Tax=Streptomyces genisteinicus TaxID=2768068 RepID=A0A7H0HS93_9ACTN|nr:hypothetical protein [Streptomyces genisteinicus]QNP63409.1 hypothetical protein IAG43_10990 [Streptomyces genisteinicus]